jgi:hypothetical protein
LSAECRATIPAIMFSPDADAGKSGLVGNLIAGGFALVGTLATVAYGWLKDSDDISKRAKELEEATKVIAFWQNWFNAYETLGYADEKAREIARDQMETASEKVASLFAFWKITAADAQRRIRNIHGRIFVPFLKRLESS